MQFTQWDNSSLNLLQEDMQDNFKIKAQWARLPSSILLPCLFDADFKLLLRSKRVIWGHNVRDALQWVFDKWKMADFGSRLSFQIHLKSTWRSSSKLSQTGSDRRNLYYSFARQEYESKVNGFFMILRPGSELTPWYPSITQCTICTYMEESYFFWTSSFSLFL